MLDNNIKKKFDAARGILVGKIPDPTMQIEQITLAMIVKFICDLKAFNLPTSWSELLDLKIDSTTLVNKYQNILKYLSQNKELPIFFSKIFNNAKLTFDDGKILRKFLKKIDEFDYKKDTEILGEGYEYLLEQYGKQGVLGQFRTPKHIIDFMVNVMQPKKNDKVHDPACGTAGFLVSTINFINQKNKRKKLKDNIKPNKKEKLFNNLIGLDVSPNMTRLALVNLFLHKVSDPNVWEFDTISDPSRWNDYYDIILTNPPFMTPKEGMVPHNKFRSKSKRCPDLFLDYLLQHLKPNGRAGIVVPDGTVSVKNKIDLRNDCFKNGLFAVCELHGFTFEPYAHVKTHIMFFDKSLKKQKILFVDIQNDGFKLSKRRTEINNNDLPEALKIIKDFKKNDEVTFKSSVSFKIIDFNKKNDQFLNFYLENKLLVTKPYIINNKDSKEKVRQYVKLIDLFDIEEGSIASDAADGVEHILYTADEKLSNHSEYTHNCESIILTYNAGGSLGRIHYANGKAKYSASNLNLILTKKNNSKYYINLFFYSNYLKYIREILVDCTSSGVGKRTLNKDRIKNFYLTLFKKDYQINANKLLQPSIKKIQLRELEILEEKEKISKFFKTK